MSEFKIRVQIYKDFIVEADTIEQAKLLVEKKAQDLFPGDKYYVNSPKDVQKAEAKRKIALEKKKEVKK